MPMQPISIGEIATPYDSTTRPSALDPNARLFCARITDCTTASFQALREVICANE
jgi:hypothetical protein